LLFEMMNNGKSPGKMALGIKVIKIDGTEGVAGDYMARWAFRSLELYMTMGAFASIMVSLSDKNQRLGDLVANTVVVKERPSFNLSLAVLLNKKTINEYQPQYPSVVHMSEEDVLFIKEVLERYRKYKNEAHREALKILADKMKVKLGITNTVGRYDEFLLTLIKDYVVLTR
ncbi:MAG TPA: RDD family protein, partial [Cytophagaceae bacterium]|nr:RDD family protein [Cytophagaceae bacterium]